MKKIVAIFLIGVIVGGSVVYFYTQDRAYRIAVKAFEGGINLREEIKTGTKQDWEALNYDKVDSLRRRAIFDSLVTLALSDEG